MFIISSGSKDRLDSVSDAGVVVMFGQVEVALVAVAQRVASALPPSERLSGVHRAFLCVFDVSEPFETTRRGDAPVMARYSTSKR